MTSKLLSNDIRELFAGFAAAIELDQIRVDALPSGQFHCNYDRDMWVMWRDAHIAFYNRLAATMDDVPAEVLEQLTEIAIHYSADDVAKTIREIACGVAPGHRRLEGQEKFGDPVTATMFLKRLITDVRRELEPAIRPFDGKASDQIRRWFPTEDPLHIALDSETGYGRPLGFVS